MFDIDLESEDTSDVEVSDASEGIAKILDANVNLFELTYHFQESKHRLSTL